MPIHGHEMACLFERGRYVRSTEIFSTGKDNAVLPARASTTSAGLEWEFKLDRTVPTGLEDRRSDDKSLEPVI